MATLSRDGLRRDQFDTLVGASGGPKWFVLYGLDQYLFSEFLPSSTSPLTTIGSSAGAWRMCCLATADPLAAIDRLAERYSNEDYSAKPTVAEITTKALAMVEYTLGASGARDIVNNSRYRTHVVVDRAKGLTAGSSKNLQSLLLGSAMLSNAVSRKTLAWFFERTIFANHADPIPAGWKDLPTHQVALTEANLIQAMMATGSIPFVLDAVSQIPGAKPGIYWDGGITDYHFDLPFNQGDKLVLYPHFSSAVIPGWFDKHIPWHKVDAKHFDNVVLVTPSKEFVASLPYGKIPDRNDFNNLAYDERLRYWRTVLDRSRQIGADFAECVATGKGLESMQPFAARDR
jgi:hypothetical protein